MNTTMIKHTTTVALGCAALSISAYAGGAPDLSSDDADTTISMPSAGGFGLSVAGVPRPLSISNGNGLVVGAPNNDVNGLFSGSAFLYEEVDGQFMLIATYHGLGQGHSLGRAVAYAGSDFFGDGDVVLGAPGTPGSGGNIVGQAYIGHHPTDTIVSLSFGGPVAGGRLGHSVAALGDIDDDFIRDFLLGEPNDLVGAGKGFVRAYSENTDSPIYSFQGEADQDMFGYAVAGMPSPGTGQQLFVVGAPNNDAAAPDAGRAYLYNSLFGGSFLRSFDGPEQEANFGWSVDLIEDLTGDNFPEVLVGAPSFFGLSNLTGTAWLYNGQTGALMRTHTGEHNGDLFGFDVSGAGDVNEDGFEDYLVGAPGNNTNGPSTGRVSLYSGQTGDLLFTFTSSNSMSNFGWSVSGRVNLEEQPIPGKILAGYDGDDIIIGAPGDTAVYVFHSSTMFAGPLPCGGADFDGDGMIGSADLAALLGAWGTFCFPPLIFCPADLNGDNQVDAADLAQILGSWGPCS